MERLERETVYAGSIATRRRMTAAEKLLGQLDESKLYPASFVRYRLTGFRSDGEVDEQVYGKALRRDLVTMVLRDSERLDLSVGERGAEAVTLDALAESWGVSGRTLRRWRSLGLLHHWIKRKSGKRCVAVFPECGQQFLAANGLRVSRAAAFRRLSAAQLSRVRSRVTELLASGRGSTDAAQEVGSLAGCSRETVRMIMRRDGLTKKLIRVRGKAARVAYRAWCAGVSISAISRRMGLPAGRVRRAIERQRWAHLTGCADGVAPSLALDRDDAAEVLLAPRAVVACSLIDPVESDSVGGRGVASGPRRGVRRGARVDPQPQLLVACAYLRVRADRGSDIDSAETDLRWASVLRQTLIASALPAAAARIEVARAAGKWVPRSASRLALQCAARAVDTADIAVAFRRGFNCARAATLLVEKLLASSGTGSASLSIKAAWAGAATRFEHLQDRSQVLLPEHRQLLAQRFGWSGRPHTLREIATQMQSTPAAISRRINALLLRMRNAK